ncbi:MAG: SAM-dependent methyltransferase [Ponticaulis sp.]|nr:SAM-dependent methyltransferase [Ponticaulis sp.]
MPLKDRLINMIELDGPMSVSMYMQTCLHDPKEGYYATRPGLGRDFLTAPEISQLFGEMIGLWVVNEWEAMWRPHPFTLVEPGPGRATMMMDALRAMKMTRAGRECLNSMQLYLVEPSLSLRAEQATKLAEHTPQFVSHVDALPDQATILIANEFLDCLPARQFVKRGKTWHEKRISAHGNELVWGIDSIQAAKLPNPPEDQNEFEYQTGLETFIESLDAYVDNGLRLRALVIDYGTDDKPPTDTLRAYLEGKQVDPLLAPGASDLTVDVDFAELVRLSKNFGLTAYGPKTQGDFLLAIGAEARMKQLIEENPDRADEIYARALRLVDPKDMGTRFKVMCFSSKGLSPPAGFE